MTKRFQKYKKPIFWPSLFVQKMNFLQKKKAISVFRCYHDLTSCKNKEQFMKTIGNTTLILCDPPFYGRPKKKNLLQGC